MLSPLKMALADIHANIPAPILQMAFNPYNDYRVSIDQEIIDKVILARVKDAVSIRGGRILDIILSQKWANITASPTPYALGVVGLYTSFTIPPEARENRDMVAATGIRLSAAIGLGLQNSFYNSLNAGGLSLKSIATQAIQSQTASNVIALPTPQIRDGNLIVLDPPQTTYVPWVVTVRLSYDDNFGNMPKGIYPAFSTVVMLAVKTYIYTQLSLAIESNAVIHGAEIGAIKNIVDSYSDANEKYEEELIKLGGAEVFDPARTARILQRVIGTY